MKFFNIIGNTLIQLVKMFGSISILLAESFKQMFKRPLRIKLFIKQVEFIGYKSIPIVILTGIFTGMVFSLQSYNGLNNFGASSMTGGLVAMAVIMELGPVLTGIMVAARAGSAMTAELGTMKVTEQIDALDALAIDPVHYLAVPRILASMVSLPLLNAICIMFALLGGYTVVVMIMGVNEATYFAHMYTYTTVNDITDSMIKAFVFGIIIATVSCHNGFNTKTGAEGVGKATTLSVVESSVFILMFDYILTSVLVL